MDIALCRCDFGYFEIREWLIRLRVDRLKNPQCEGTWLYIARSPNCEFGVYGALRLGCRAFVIGFGGFHAPRRARQARRSRATSGVPRLRGAPAPSRPQLRMPPALAGAVTSHTNRTSAPSEAAHSGLLPHERSHLAGVRFTNFLLGYTCELESGRIRASWPLGLLGTEPPPGKLREGAPFEFELGPTTPSRARAEDTARSGDSWALGVFFLGGRDKSNHGSKTGQGKWEVGETDPMPI